MKRLAVGLILVVILAGALAMGLQRTQLLGWYYAQRLAKASAGERTVWVDRLITLDQAALPNLIRLLREDDATAGDNCRLALLGLAKRWEADDRRLEELFNLLVGTYGDLSVSGQQSVLNFAQEFLASKRADLRSTHSGVVGVSQWLESCRKMIRTALENSRPENRVQAIRLAQRPEVNSLEQVVALLGDSDAEIRRAAMLAVGPAPEVIADEDLLYYLHDHDAKVRQLCETALQGRGLRDNQLQLGKLMTDPRPEIRVEIFDYLQQVSDLEPGVWLRRLSHDPSPAVRAAAIRSAAELPFVDLNDRLEQMIQNDPSPTVQQLAQYYLSYLKRESASRENRLPAKRTASVSP